MISEEFEQLISQREGEETLDFKQEMISSSDLARLVTAFYNARGGTIVFGVENGTRRLVGVPNLHAIDDSSLVGRSDKMFFQLSYAAGLRISEATHLRVEDIDWAEGCTYLLCAAVARA